jgi:hypothetical protein
MLRNHPLQKLTQLTIEAAMYLLLIVELTKLLMGALMR